MCGFYVIVREGICGVLLIDNLYLSHTLMALGALLCLRATAHEARGRRMRPLRLLGPPLFATFTALVLLVSPSGELWLPAVWVLGLLVGMVRGFAVRLYVDHLWNLIRVPRARDGLWGALALVLMVALEVVATLVGSTGTPYQAMLAAGVAFCAGLLAGRAWAVSMRIRRSPHNQLRRP